MKTEGVNSWFFWIHYIQINRKNFVMHCWRLGPINEWFFSVLPETLLLQKPRGLPFNSFKRDRNQVCFAHGWRRCMLQCSTGGSRIGHPGAISGISLEHELPVYLGQHWLQRDAGLRKSSPMPKTGFLVKDPSHQLVILSSLNCQVTPWKAAHGFSLSFCKWEQWHNPWRGSSLKYSWLFPGTFGARLGSLQVLQKNLLTPSAMRRTALVMPKPDYLLLKWTICPHPASFVQRVEQQPWPVLKHARILPSFRVSKGWVGAGAGAGESHELQPADDTGLLRPRKAWNISCTCKSSSHICVRIWGNHKMTRITWLSLGAWFLWDSH